MSSIIEGYNYDIFISYRQKDNKGDRWVSEFVEALKTELESTFKEEISVYFDINPHDGLLETHDVDGSLKEKLKCLIFIPIISRTYCDPKSFAWEHEFKAFVEEASQDQFGLKVKLPNGNVTSRVLPVRIYDLDTTDIKLCQSVLGGVLRGVDFKYEEPGVNRPLKPDDDEKINLNKTKYRNQINKVANAIKEVITSTGQFGQNHEEVKKEIPKPISVPQKNNRTKIIIGSIIALVLIILCFFLIPNLFNSEERLEKSIAVLPFVNLSNDPEQEYFSDGVVEAILNHLFKVGELKVISSTSTKRYKNTELSLKEIAKELGVSSILEGSVQKIGNNVRITTQLIDSRNDVHLWSETYDKDLSDIFLIQTEVAQNVARELKATLTSDEKAQIEKSQTKNPEAYNLYLQGRFHMSKRTEEELNKSVEYFEKAVAADPDYALAYAGLADAYFLMTWWRFIPWVEGYARAKEYVLRALDIDKGLAEAHTVLGGILYWRDWNFEEARKELLLAIELNPNHGPTHQYYSELLDILGQIDEAHLQINIALKLDPFFFMYHSMSAMYYYNEAKLKESLGEYQVVNELNPVNSPGLRGMFNIYIKQGEDIKAVETLQKIMLLDTLTAKNATVVKEIYNNSGINGLLNFLIELELKKSRPSFYTLAVRYAMQEKNEEALDWLEKGLEENDPNILRINSNPDFDILRSEPRFQAMIKKMGLSGYQKRQ
jgi:TolB-like protein